MKGYAVTVHYVRMELSNSLLPIPSEYYHRGSHHCSQSCCTSYPESCMPSWPQMSSSTGQPGEFSRLLVACSWTHGTFSLSLGSWNTGSDSGAAKEFDCTGCAWDNEFWPRGNASKRYWRLRRLIARLLSAVISIVPFGWSMICPETDGIDGGCS